MAGGDNIAEQLRCLARKRVVTAQQFLAELDQDYFSDVDLDLVTVPATDRDVLLPVLLAKVDERSGTIWLNAAWALAKFGHRVGWEALIESLQSEDPALRYGALGRLSCFGIRDQLRSRSSAVDADAFLTALEPLLADSNLWRRAVPLIGDLGTPRAVDRLVTLLDDARPDVCVEAACTLARGGHDRGALAVIDEQLRVLRQTRRCDLIRALECLCKSADAGISARAASVAIDFVRSNLAEHGKAAHEAAFAVDDIWRCMAGIAAGCSASQREALHVALRQVLREVVASKIEGWIRGMALKQLAELEGKAGIARLLGALSDPDLRKDALEGLTSLAAGSDDPAVLAALSDEIQRGKATHISALVKAFLAAGGNAKSLARDIVDRLEPEMAMTVRWLLNDIGPREAAAKLRPACGDVPASDKVLKELDAQWRTDPDARHVVWTLLGGWHRIACVFYKTVQSPVDHDETVYEIAAIAGERFAVDDVVQKIESSGNFRILLVHQGTGYSFPVEDHGRWCNVRAVIDGLNGILDRLGLPERFIEHSSGTSDVALVTFARADLFMPVARELDIQLGRAE